MGWAGLRDSWEFASCMFMDQLLPGVNTNTDSLVFPANENVYVAVGELVL